MDKKEKAIREHIGKALDLAGKAKDELEEALNIALSGKGLSKEERLLLSVDFANSTEEAVERVRDGLDDDFDYYDNDIQDLSINQVYKMTAEQIRETFKL